MAYSVGKYALSTADVNGVEGRKQKAAARAAAAKTAATAVPQLHAETA